VPEKALLRKVSVFVGGFTFDAVERVASEAAAASRRSAHTSQLELLAQLVGKSLVIREEHGERYRLLETIRQYGLKKLREAGEEDLARCRHAAYYAALAHRAEPELFGPEQLAWFDRFEAEHHNIRAALDWIGSALERGDHELGPAVLEAGAALGWFWIARGYFTDGWRRLPELLRLTGPATRTPARVDALHHASACCYILGDHAPIPGLIEEAIQLGRELGYARGTAMALKGLGVMAHAEGAPERAACLYDEGLAVARGAGDTVATYLLLIWQSDLDRARGRFDHAAALLEESLSLTRNQGDRWWMGHALARLAHLALLRGDYARATTLGRDGLNRRWELHDRQGAAWNLELLAWVAGAWGRPERATHLLGAAQAARERSGARLLPQEQDGHDRTRSAARAALGEEAFVAAWAEGHARPPERAVQYALASDTPATAPTGSCTTSRNGSSNDGVLTARERETVRLIALGLNNRQLAEALVISRGAAANYVQRVFAKLGFHARAQVAAWAVEHGLGPGADTTL
jgi:non-specific serine/threonine protein kinase